MSILNNTILHGDYSSFSLFDNPDGSNPADYKAARNNYIARKEDAPRFNAQSNFTIIDDSKHLPTIGYGFNLDAFNINQIREGLTFALGGSLSSLQNAGIDVLDRWKNASSYPVAQRLTAQNIIDIANGIYGTASERSALGSLSLSASQAYSLLDAMLDGEVSFVNYEGGLSNKLGAGDLSYSTERIALLSAYYNAPGLIGQGMVAAVNHDDPTSRAEAWFQLLYYHANYNENVMNRREEEANKLLHLTSNNSNHNAHIEEIKYALDFLFNGKTTNGNVDVYTTIEARDDVKPFETAISAELTELINEYAPGFQGGIHYVQRDKDGQSSTMNAKAADGKTDNNTNNIIFGEDGNDIISGKGGKDILLGGSGNDTLIGGTGNDIMDGGSDIDTVKYEDSVILTNVKIFENTSPVAAPSTSQETDIISNVEKIEGTSGNDTFDIRLLANTKVTNIDTGNGNDTVSVQGSLVGLNPVIDLGAGDDVLLEAPRGSIVYGGTGNDTFALGSDYLIADADAGDKLVYFGNKLFGGITWRGQESPWAKGIGGIKYGLGESDNELVIQDRSGHDTYVANFTSQFSGETAGIRIGQIMMETYRLIASPKGAMIYESFEAIFGYYLKIMTGQSYFAGVDPLVLDLDGDGIELSARSSISPFYDIDADDFAEKSGRVSGVGNDDYAIGLKVA